jgi:F-type H+-transporting ATPase subunit b
MDNVLQDTYFWTGLSFVIFIALVWWLGRKSVTRQLDGKIKEIRKELDTAESLRVEAQEMLAQYQRKQRDAIAESEEIISSAQNHAAHIRKNAERELEDMIARKEEMAAIRIERLQQKAVGEIRRKAAGMALLAAEDLIARNMNKKTRDDLVDQSIDNISLPSR